MTKITVWCDICKKYVEVEEIVINDEYYAIMTYRLVCGHNFRTQIAVRETDVCHFEKLLAEYR